MIPSAVIARRVGDKISTSWGAGAVRDVVSKLLGSAAQVTTESGASSIAALDLVSPDDILGADSDLQRALVLDRYGTFAACALGHHTFATN